MRAFSLFAALPAALLFACAQPETNGSTPFELSPEEQAEMMGQAMAMGMPGPEHEELMERVGNWTVSVRMLGADGVWTETTGTASMEMQFGGRYLVESFSMDMGGMPFNGEFITTYDNYHKQYVGLWYDDMSTHPVVMRGELADDGWVELRAEIVDAYSPNGRLFKHRTIQNEDGSLSLEFLDTYPGADEVRGMEMTYRRAE